MNFASEVETSFIIFTPLKIQSHLSIRFLLSCLTINASKDSHTPKDTFAHLAYKRTFLSQFFSLGNDDG